MAITYMVNMGITVGAHRYYTHKTFKAKLLLRYFFLLGQTLAGQVRYLLTYTTTEIRNQKIYLKKCALHSHPCNCR